MKPFLLLSFLTLVVLLSFFSLPVTPGSASHARPSLNAGAAADLVVGVPMDDLQTPGNFPDAGAIHILFGVYPGGLSGTYDLYWHEDIPGIADQVSSNDNFGGALGIGDFNCDGLDDMAVSAPGNWVFFDGNYRLNAGIVHVFYIDSSMPLGYLDSTFDQNVGTIQSNPEDGDRFGSALATGDFNGDGCADLAVGSPDEDWNLDQAGIVQVIYGSPTLLTDSGNQLFRQGASGILETEEIGDRFGQALASADFDRDGYADLAVGVPYEDHTGSPELEDAGLVQILYGSAAGLTGLRDQIFHQDMPGVEGNAGSNEQFGAALTTGDYNGDHFPDLAIGVPNETVSGQVQAGAVHVLFGSPTGLTTNSDIILDLSTLSLAGSAYSWFGADLAASDFNRDGIADLVVAAWGEGFGGVFHPGAVYVIYGNQPWVYPFTYQRLFQGGELLDIPENDDYFGNGLAAGDFNGDAFGDLAIGAPGEDLGSPTISKAGALHVLYGSGTGLSLAGDQFWYQGYNGLGGVPAENDQFGVVLAARPFLPVLIYLPLVQQ